MFHNYQELFYGYADYFSEKLFDFDQQQQYKQLQKLNGSTTSSSQTTILHRSTRSINHSKDLVASWTSALAEQFPRTDTNNLSTLSTRGQIEEETAARQQQQQPTIGTFNEITGADWLCMVTIFLNLLFMKRCLSKWMKTSNLVKSLGLRKKDQERLDESLWRFLYYTFSSTWLLYTCFLRHQAHKYFDKNATIAEYLFGVDLDEYLICMIEAGFYVHASYAIVFEDVWRRDSPMMLLHHGAAIFSVLGIYATRTHRIGLAVVILRDTCDVLLEVTKIVLCLRVQHGKIINCMDKLVKCMLVVFTVAFVVNQLYYYPLYCLYHAFQLVKQYRLKTPAVTGILTCCLIFLLLDLLWFGLILRLLYRMLFTNEPTIDLREYDDESSAETASLSSLDDCKSEKKRKKLAKKEKEKEKAKID